MVPLLATIFLTILPFAHCAIRLISQKCSLLAYSHRNLTNLATFLFPPFIELRGRHHWEKLPLLASPAAKPWVLSPLIPSLYFCVEGTPVFADFIELHKISLRSHVLKIHLTTRSPALLASSRHRALSLFFSQLLLLINLWLAWRRRSPVPPSYRTLLLPNLRSVYLTISAFLNRHPERPSAQTWLTCCLLASAVSVSPRSHANHIL